MNPIGLASLFRPIHNDSRLCGYTPLRNCAITTLQCTSSAGFLATGFVPAPFKPVILSSSLFALACASYLLSPACYNNAEKIKAFLSSENKDLLTSDLTTEDFEHFANHNLATHDFIYAIRACIKADRIDLAKTILNIFISRPIDDETHSYLVPILNMCLNIHKYELVDLILEGHPELLSEAVDKTFREAMTDDSKYSTLSFLLTKGSIDQSQIDQHLSIAVRIDCSKLVDILLTNQQISQFCRQSCLMIASRRGNVEQVHLLVKSGFVSDEIKESALNQLIAKLPQPIHPAREAFYRSLFKTTSLLKLLAMNNEFYHFFPDSWKSHVGHFFELNQIIHEKLDELEESPFQINPNGSNAQQIPPSPITPLKEDLEKLRVVLNLTLHGSYF